MKQRAVVILIVVLCGPLLMWNTQLRLSVIQYRTSSDACLDKLNRLSAENTRLAGKVRCLGLTNAWNGPTDSCDSWVAADPDRCTAGNYASNCKRSCCELASDHVKNYLSDEWDPRSCFKWVFAEEDRCDTEQYQKNCARVCNDMTGGVDEAGTTECKKLVGGDLRGCYDFDRQRSCMKTCFPFLENITHREIPKLDPAALNCRKDAEPADLGIHGGVVRQPIPYTYSRRRGLLWEQRLTLLHTVSSVLRAHRIVHWIIDGTLLGSYRHGEPIPWDDDMDMLIAGGNATSYSLGGDSAIGKELSAKNVSVRNGVYPCDAQVYTAMCKYMDMKKLDVSNYFVVFQDKHDSRAWIDASIELPVELNGKKGWSIDGSWNLIDDKVYSQMIHPLKTAKFGRHEFPVPRQTKAFLCSTVGSDLDMPGTWNVKTKKWDIVDKWDVLTDKDKFTGSNKLRLVLDDDKLKIVANS